MKKTVLISLVSMMLLSSCSKTFYQVYTTKSTNLIEKNNSLVYENDDCTLFYNLWAEDGNAGFIFHNKTDRDLFIILPQTFFIKNGIAFDYFQNREYSNTQMSSVSTGVSLGTSIYGKTEIWGNRYDASKYVNVDGKVVKGASSTIISKESPIICIPPHSSKLINEYCISDYLIRQCNSKQAYPKSQSLPLEYTKENSPLTFKNRIAYSFNNKGENLQYIENEFWVSELINYSEKYIIEEKDYKECEGDISTKQYQFTKSAPNKFYLLYKGSASANKFTNGL